MLAELQKVALCPRATPFFEGARWLANALRITSEQPARRTCELEYLENLRSLREMGRLQLLREG